MTALQVIPDLRDKIKMFKQFLHASKLPKGAMGLKMKLSIVY